MTMFDQRTVFEKMTHQRPLPDEPYFGMHKDGYTPEEIRETAARSIMRHKFAEMEERAAAEESQFPMGLKLTSEITVK